VDDPVFDLTTCFVHLGLGGTVVPVPEFDWTPDALARHEARFDTDGDDGRLVTVLPQAQTWDSWERHPAGDELVVVLSGHLELVQQMDGDTRRLSLTAGQAAINPRGVWHTAVVHEPGHALFVTAGRGTEVHRP